jgi:fucose permease
LFLIGTGLALLQSAANPYITIVGPINRAAQRIRMMRLCNKVAGIIAPLIFATVVLKVTDKSKIDDLGTGINSVFQYPSI